MPTSSTTPNPFTRAQKEPATVVLKDRDGVVDTDTPITWTSDDTSVVTVSQDTLGRNICLRGEGPSGGPVNVRGVADLGTAHGGTVTLLIGCTVGDAPNNAIIEATFGTAVPKS